MTQALLVRLGLVPYIETYELQRRLAEAVMEGTLPDLVLFLEHPPVVTTGRRTDSDEIHLPAGVEVEVVETDRGGKSTFHGPGQLVCYPIFDLNRHGKDIKRYVRDLEEALIRTVGAFGLEAIRVDTFTGAWLPATRERPARKIASIGVHVKRWVTTHGYALNVNVDPAPFTEWITACGLEDAAFTSLALELARPVEVADVLPHAATAMAEVFGLDLEEVELETLGRMCDQQPVAESRF